MKTTRIKIPMFATASLLISVSAWAIDLPAAGLYPLRDGGGNCGDFAKAERAEQKDVYPGLALSRMEKANDPDINGHERLVSTSKITYRTLGSQKIASGDATLTVNQNSTANGALEFKGILDYPSRDPSDNGATFYSRISISADGKILNVDWNSTDVPAKKSACRYNL